MSPALRIVVWMSLSLAAPVPLALSAEGKADPARMEYFESKVRPLLANHCQGCHGPEKQKAGLRLDSRAALARGGDSGPVVQPGNPEASRLIEAVRYGGDVQMPPKRKLADAEIDVLSQWIKMGAEWPESATQTRPPAAAAAPVISAEDRAFWSFQPIRDLSPPAVKDKSWPRSEIDRFVLATLEEKGLKPVAQADKRALIRRATFDLTGLPPTVDEIDAFLADRAPEAFARVIDRLLASPHYGERWGRHWLDVARYGEDQAHTFEARVYPNGYRYRDWVVKALNADMPYDRFVSLQIAGDLLDGPDRDDRLAATGYFALGPVYYGGAVYDELDDRVDTLCRGFLGLTVACARCHDHKFDPIPQQDYYSLTGVFSSTRYEEYPQAPPEAVTRYDESQAKIKAKTGDVNKQRKALNEAKSDGDKAKAKDELKKAQQELDKLKKEAPPKYPFIHGLAEGKSIANMRVHLRGNPANLGAEAPRRFLAVLSAENQSPFREGSGRLELARAIASPQNPLTARVLVNRVWAQHVGRGLVATPSNFGKLGERPSHPALLDYLASRFIASGWSLKALHRTIMLSATYQLAAANNAHNATVDADNVWLWRANRRRLEVEAWRDAMLAVSGQLDPRLGGPSANLNAAENRSRTIYGAVSRHNLDGLLRLFDFPDPNITSDKRTITTVPLQQLFVLNSPFLERQAHGLAGRLTANASEPDAERIRRAYLLLYGRPARDREVALGIAYLAGGGDGPPRWERYAQALLASNEFLYVD
ncbi:MAG: DUF1549 domain-containing protein [Isosphaeraceae bacterium]|nr:DUF1549 domain-containing protein [Isosphaeraceae bacterium]